MSMPTFPEHGIDLTKEQAFHMLLGSIAMEELALSHIMNAEGEKLQYLLGTLPNGCSHCATPQELLAVNHSVTQVMEHINQSQLLLKGKLEQVLRAMECYEPCVQKPSQTQTTCAQACTQFNCVLTTAKRETWKKGGRLGWKMECCTGGLCCWHAETPTCIYLPFGKRLLLSYSLQVSAPEAGRVCMAVQLLQNGIAEDVGACEACAMQAGETVHLSSSVSLSHEQMGVNPAKAFLVLRGPAAVTVQQGSLRLIVLP